jgi:bile acid:Na+ symporter, BASS family
MSLDQVISVLVSVTLIEMSFATGLGVRLADVVGAAKDGQQLLGAALANYVAVPAAAVTLILLLDADPLVAAGILILAVCPGAPYGPPLTALARGATATSIGLMVLLAGSSVVLAPLLLSVLLPLTSGPASQSARDACGHRGNPASPAVRRARCQPSAARSGGALAQPDDRDQQDP